MLFSDARMQLLMANEVILRLDIGQESRPLSASSRGTAPARAKATCADHAFCILHWLQLLQDAASRVFMSCIHIPVLCLLHSCDYNEMWTGWRSIFMSSGPSHLQDEFISFVKDNKKVSREGIELVRWVYSILNIGMSRIWVEFDLLVFYWFLSNKKMILQVQNLIEYCWQLYKNNEEAIWPSSFTVFGENQLYSQYCISFCAYIVHLWHFLFATWDIWTHLPACKYSVHVSFLPGCWPYYAHNQSVCLWYIEYFAFCIHHS